MKDGKFVVGITMGDPNGIGPELALKLFSDARMFRTCIPVVYGSAKVLGQYKELYAMEEPVLQTLKQAQHGNDRKLSIIETSPWLEAATPGTPSTDGGKAAFEALERAVRDLKAGEIDALLTLPIDKATIQSDAFKFVGHTEYLAQQASAQDVLMLMVHDHLRVAVATTHIPVGQVPKALSANTIANKLKLMAASIRLDFGVAKPKLAVLGLNPHAGDNGVIGTEDRDIVMPGIDKARNEGLLVYGPYPADGFFAMGNWRKFDGILAMYHDQGLVPFKTLAEGYGVNFTAGLPFIRTSPDHGTAYDIAGKNVADVTSTRNALYVAVDTVRMRTENRELLQNALKPAPLPDFMKNEVDEVLRDEA